MVDASETKRLEQAIAWLATTIAEIITERVRRLEAEAERTIRNLPEKVEDPMLTKKELAQRLGIGVRTVDSWMVRRVVPYFKIGKSVRFRWKEVYGYLKRLEIRPRW